MSQDTKKTFSIKKINFKKLPIKRMLLVAVPIAIAVGVFLNGTNAGVVAQASEYIEYTVSTQDISKSLSGTGTLSPANSYTVSTMVEADIIADYFEEGDMVEKDQVLYQFDTTEMNSTIEQAEISHAQSERSYATQVDTLSDLNVKATKSGQVLDILVEVGDEVTQNQTVATIRDSATMTLEVYFGANDVKNFYVGQSATVTVDGTFETVTGTISNINTVEEVLDGNMLGSKIEIDVQNPGAITPDMSASAMVGSVASIKAGTFQYNAESEVKTSVSGEVSKINAQEGQTVSDGTTLLTLTSDSVTNSVANSADSLRNSEISLENKYDQLEDYTITSPIAGTIVEKNYQAGDLSESNQALCTIFDLSYLEMTLNIDELDIFDIEVGQKVEITADALEGEVYEGEVTKVNINGSTASGSTVYPVTIKITEIGELLPGMNVQAEIVVEEKTDALAIPVEALLRGNIVYVKSDGASTGDTDTTQDDATGVTPPEGTEGMTRPEGSEGATRPEGTEGATRPNAGASDDETSGETARPSNTTSTDISTNLDIPEGYVAVVVEVGTSNDDYIEITSGLSAGDVITYEQVTMTLSSDEDMMMPGMMPSGGMTTGGAPTGGGGGTGRPN